MILKAAGTPEGDRERIVRGAGIENPVSSVDSQLDSWLDRDAHAVKDFAAKPQLVEPR
jgi:hypothetical protein